MSPQALIEALNPWLSVASDSCAEREPTESEKTAAGDAGRPSVSVFDRAGLLARLMDDEELAANILARSRETTPRQLASLRNSVAAGDAAVAQRVAHSIKGAASNVNAESLQHVAFRIEQATEAGDLIAAEGLIAELETEFQRFQAASTAAEQGRG